MKIIRMLNVQINICNRQNTVLLSLLSKLMLGWKIQMLADAH